MTLISQILIALLYTAAVLITLGGLWFIFALCWVAKGEPDVNGDPERDAGYSEEQIADTHKRYEHDTPDECIKRMEKWFNEAIQWRCECGEIASPLSGEWRFNGSGWEHYHGYPIGHVLAHREPDNQPPTT